MASDRTVYHVVPNAGGNAWVVSQEKAELKIELIGNLVSALGRRRWQ